MQLSTWRREGIMARFHFSRSGAPAMLRIRQEALTFDDILLVPGYSEVLPKDVCLKTHLTRGIELSMPLVSAAMDTVTEARLARSEEHTSELQSRPHLVCRLLLEKKKNNIISSRPRE